MSPIEAASLFRGVERILIVGGGLMALYLGYRLFLGGLNSEQSGEFAGKSFSIKLIKVGPGVFFALFGTCVLMAMTWQNIRIQFSGTNKSSGSINQFGSTEKSRLDRTIEELAGIKVLVDEGMVSKAPIIKALTVAQKGLARVRLGDDIYQKCEHNPPQQPDQDCLIYEKLIK